MLNQDQSITMGGSESHKEESVDDLLAKLAQKGKKVKLIDENYASPSKIDDGLDEREDLGDEDLAVTNHKSGQSSVKKKMNKIKKNREEEDQVTKQQKQIIEDTNKQLQDEAQKRIDL